jgi:hypothetical protein
MVINKYKTQMNLFKKLFFLSFIIPLQLYGQQSNSMYYMDWVPQTHILNPAHQPKCNLYLGCPGLNNIHFNYKNSFIDYNNIFFQRGDTTINLLNDQGADLQGFLNSMKPYNFISTDASFGIASFGFRLQNDFYITFDIRERVSSRLSLPKDITLLLDENGNSKGKFEMNGLGIDLKHFREYALGVSHNLEDNLIIGIKAKLLYGKGYFSTYNNFDITANMKEWSIPPNSIEINASMPFFSPTYDEDGYLDDFEKNEDIDPIDDYILNSNNWGAAADIGIIYKPIDAVELNFSWLDLGGISWKQDAYTFTQSGIAEFEGANLSSAIEDSIDTDQFEEMIDSLNLSGKSTSFYAPLTSKIYLGGRYHATEEVSFGVISKTEIYKSRLYPQLTLSANFNSNFLGFVVSYSMLHNSYNNFGLGFNFKVGPLNMYFISDNIPFGLNDVVPKGNTEAESIPVPYKFRYADFRFGLNLLFGCRKKITDLPLIE